MILKLMVCLPVTLFLFSCSQEEKHATECEVATCNDAVSASGSENDSSEFADIENRIYISYTNRPDLSEADAVREEYGLKLMPYIFIQKDGIAEIRLTEKEALAMGVPADYYNEFMGEWRKYNEFFEEAKAEGSIIVGMDRIAAYYDAYRAGYIEPNKDYLHGPKIPSIRKRMSHR